MKAMAPNPDNRYPSADAMLADLEEFRKNPSINFDYDVSEFVPEEPEESAMTQIRTPHTPVRSRVPEPEPRRRRYEEPEEEEEEPAEIGVEFPAKDLAVISAALCAAAAAFWWVWRKLTR